MGFHLHLFIIFVSFPVIFALDVTNVTLLLDGTKTIAETDANFICATLDLWPPQKCNYNNCPWGASSALNLDLSNPLFAKAIQAFNGLRMRIGGTLQDSLLYNIGHLRSPCHPFRRDDHALFGFSRGCLLRSRWDELNAFFTKTRAIVTFGLNALYGRPKLKGNAWGGPWDSTNAENLINYTVSKGYHIDSWEFGNELSGTGIGASIDAAQYGNDITKLKEIINKLYHKSASEPTLIAPGGFFDKEWFRKLLQVSGPNVVNFVTHHIYNLGPGSDLHLVDKILNPTYLDKISSLFKDVQQTVRQFGPWASAWVGESGGAYNSGGPGVSNTFVNSFWYLDQLGASSMYDTKVYCRQTMIGGNYGLLNTTTFAPNPDYYSALLWHRLMGQKVLPVMSDASGFLRTYAHCGKQKDEGVTLLFINLSRNNKFLINVKNILNRDEGKKYVNHDKYVGLEKLMWWVGKKASKNDVRRYEYHLTPQNRNIRSQIVLLNGKALEITGSGDIPSLDPLLVNINLPIAIAPLSIAFVTLPNFEAPACV
ncbi:unnamed protein product [Rhodiola kirilowii]